MNQLEDVTTTAAPASLQESARVDDDIQTAISQMLAVGEDQEACLNIYSPLETGNISLLESANHNNSSFGHGTQVAASMGGGQRQRPFKAWWQSGVLAPMLQKNDRSNQELLRRCIDLMKQIPNLQQGGAHNQNGSAETQAPVQQQQGPRAASSSSPETAPSPETVPDIGIAHDPFDQVL